LPPTVAPKFVNPYSIAFIPNSVTNYFPPTSIHFSVTPATNSSAVVLIIVPIELLTLALEIPYYA